LKPRPDLMRGKCYRQRGVAVVTALLLTTLAITIVGSLFWQQQVQVRSIENQRLQLQKQWILRGALDWTRLILREDARYSKVDHLGEPWAVTLAETRLDQYVENGATAGEIPDAALSGGIIDAQSRFNLTNLSQGGKVNPTEVQAFARLLTNLRQNPVLAQATADLMAASQVNTQTPSGTPGASGGPGTTGQPSQSVGVFYVDDLLAVPGFSPEVLAAIKDFVVVLPEATPVNVNTASAEVIAARVEGLSLSEATALVAGREAAYFNTTSDFAQRSGKSSAGQIDVSTRYFLVNGNVRLNRATMEMQALIQRNGTVTKVIWIREN